MNRPNTTNIRPYFVASIETLENQKFACTVTVTDDAMHDEIFTFESFIN